MDAKESVTVEVLYISTKQLSSNNVEMVKVSALQNVV